MAEMTDDEPRDALTQAVRTPRRPTFRGTWLARHWPYIAAVVAVLLAVGVMPNVVAKQALARELARLRAEGAPITEADAVSPPVPDAQNAAIVYGQAVGRLLTPGRGGDTSQVYRFVFSHSAGGSIFGGAAPSLAHVEAIMARHQAELDLLDQGSRMPAAHFGGYHGRGATASRDAAAVFSTSTATWYLAAKAMVDARRGRGGPALDDLEVALRVSAHIGREPNVMGLWGASSCVEAVSQALPEVLQAAPPTEKEARDFYDALAKVDSTDAWVSQLAGQRAAGISYFNFVRKSPVVDPRQLWGRAFKAPELVPGLKKLGKAGHLIKRPALDLDEAYYLRFMRRVIENAKLPARDGRLAQAKLEQEVRDSAPRYATVTRFLAWLYSGQHVRRNDGVAQLRLMQAAMALRAYQIRHGAYPTSLAELRRAGGWPVADDPYTDQPLVYKRRGAGYLIYSLGPDGKDQGGAPKAPFSNFPGDPDYDVPLRINR